MDNNTSMGAIKTFDTPKSSFNNKINTPTPGVISNPTPNMPIITTMSTHHSTASASIPVSSPGSGIIKNFDAPKSTLNSAVNASTPVNTIGSSTIKPFDTPKSSFSGAINVPTPGVISNPKPTMPVMSTMSTSTTESAPINVSGSGIIRTLDNPKSAFDSTIHTPTLGVISDPKPIMTTISTTSAPSTPATPAGVINTLDNPKSAFDSTIHTPTLGVISDSKPSIPMSTSTTSQSPLSSVMSSSSSVAIMSTASSIPDEIQKQSELITEKTDQLEKILNTVNDTLSQIGIIVDGYSDDLSGQIKHLTSSIDSYKVKARNIYGELADSLSSYANNMKHNFEELTTGISRIVSIIDQL